MPSFTYARQQHSVCHFNDKFLFIFGGKKLEANAQIVAKGQDGKNAAFYEPFQFVNEVEVYEISKGVWKTINYISEPERLSIISPGSMQVSGS